MTISFMCKIVKMHIVLYEPDIPGNTGNVARTCVATGSTLHLVGRLGFNLDDAHLKRAGLDYWPKLRWMRHADWEAFETALPPRPALYIFSKWAKQSYWSATFAPESYLIFGCETQGLPSFFHERFQERLYAIPMAPESVRSLNLSNSVALVLYEALRQTHSPSNLVLHASHLTQTA
jgi:tRNA (cytidine/uridine-2'-O-)-methyltransferase